MNEAILFDFDLTLADSSAAVVDCTRFAMDRLELANPDAEAVRRTIGLPLPDLFKVLTGRTEPALVNTFSQLFLERADEVVVPLTTLYPRSAEVLADLRRRRILTAIVSTKFRYRIEAILQSAGAGDMVDVIVGGDDVTRHKPDPEPIHRALSQLAADPGKSLYVGDHPVDALAAQNAGIRFVRVMTGADHGNGAWGGVCPHATLQDIGGILDLEEVRSSPILTQPMDTQQPQTEERIRAAHSGEVKPLAGSMESSESDRLSAIRRFYSRLVASNAAVNDARIIEAFASVERERFVGPGPWQIKTANGYLSTQTNDPAVLYQDILVGLVPPKGIHNGEPSLHAKCLTAVAPQSGDTVIHIGAGSGYYTAMLAHLVGPTGRVHAFEIEPQLASRARQELPAWCCVHELSAVDTRLLPSADVIYVSAGVTHIPLHWLDALKPDGRLLLPLTPSHGLGCMLLISRRDGTTYPARAISPAAFIPCVGANDEGGSLKLATALDTRSPDAIRSLRRGVQPDETAWYAGEGWWLSTSDADR